MNSFNFLSSPVADALGWTLLHAIWQGFALVLPAAVALHLLRNRSSDLRYRIGTLTLLGQLLISAATFVWCYSPVMPSHASTSMMVTAQALPVRWQTVAQTLPWPQQMQLFLANHLGQFVLMYLVGVALFGLRLAGGWLYLQRLTRTATQPAAALCQQLANHIRSTLAIKTIVQVRESARIAVPMVVGVLKPVLLLPIGLVTNLTTREIEAVLAHELAHVKRHDYAVNLLQSVVEVLYFFHPALWWLSARVREEREHCCDDLAVQACGGDGRILARALAHVEELRLTPVESTPRLAMALTTNRQQLLHRVQRMLGVPTRPLVSNGSLAGLTLVTILLMSVSVYAVQKQNQPKPAKSPSPSTRRHKAGNGSEFTIIDNKKVDYIIWKGQKLPANRIARLQKQFDQVMSGQLSLDAVKQPDRDILLTILETNQGHQEGMEDLAEGLSHIDYSNIVASALKNVPLSPDGTVEGLAKVNYNAIMENALASLSAPAIASLSDTLDKRSMYNQRQVDSLNQLIAQRTKQMQAIQLQMEKLRFPIEEIERNQEVLNWRKDKLMEQRTALIEKHQRLLYNDGKQKLSQLDIEKQIAALEPEIKKLESNMEALSHEFEAVSAKEEEVKLPLEKLERQSEQLEEQLDKLSSQLDEHSAGLDRITPGDITVNVNGDARAFRSNRMRTPRATTRTLRGIIAPAAPMPPAITVRALPAPKPTTPTLAPTPPLTRTLRGIAAPAAPIPPGVKVRKIVFPKPAPAPAIPSVPAASTPATRIRE
ncbi:hypothetical protein GCM10028818_28100 [Spirosoma horti]